MVKEINNKEYLKTLLSQLSLVEQYILSMRFVDDLNVKEIAFILDLSKEYVEEQLIKLLMLIKREVGCL